ncbi:MAG TPA: hypothetical protein VJ870_17885 [Amycolatopsis sp.]|nr:hypothetical protein [Amycolatopsis sp.]
MRPRPPASWPGAPTSPALDATFAFAVGVTLIATVYRHVLRCAGTPPGTRSKM